MDQKLNSLLIEAVDRLSYLNQNQLLVASAQDALDNNETNKAGVLLNNYLDSASEVFELLTRVLGDCREINRITDLTARAQRHRPLLEAIPAVTVTLHDASDRFNGHPYLDVYAAIPERLNKPREQLIGKPVTTVSPVIGEPRLHYIRRALANGQCERYSYEYQDDHLWKFDVTVAPLYGTEEIITIVTDAEPWQAGYWLNRVSTQES